MGLESRSGVDRHDKLPETGGSAEYPVNIRLEHGLRFTRKNLVELIFGKAIPSSCFEDDHAVRVTCTIDVK